MERKEFLKQCGKLCLGGLAAGVLLESCMGTYYAATSQTSPTIISIKKTEFINAEKNKARKQILVRSEKLNFPICVYKLNEQVYSALLMECTHKSCELNPHGDFLICPCHGSEFSNLGIVQNPPAETDLKTFNVTHNDENIFLHLS
jgi:cytochrome b6-f complex iron-sulfur subunit